jgi:hypothetical protein
MTGNRSKAGTGTISSVFAVKPPSPPSVAFATAIAPDTVSGTRRAS